MMTEKQKREYTIKTGMPMGYLERFDSEWSKAVDRLMKSGADIGKIKISGEGMKNVGRDNP